MKVLHIISGFDRGGAKTAVLTLLGALRDKCTAELACLGDGIVAQEARALGFDPIVINRGRAFKPLKNVILSGGYDVIHSHGSRANALSVLLKPFVKLPSICTIHSEYRQDYRGRGVKGAVFDLINRFALSRIDNYLCVSKSMAVKTRIARGVKPSRVHVCHNGFDPGRAALKLTFAEKRNFLRSFGLDYTEDCVVVGFAGRLEPVKDCAALVRAFAEAVKERGELRLLIAGDGTERNSLETLATQLIPAGKHAFAGWLENTEPFYAAIDINTLTSIDEAFGYVLLEGSRYSLATVSSDSGGPGEILTDGFSGLLFKPGDISALTDALLLLAKNPELRRTLGDNLRQSAAENFSLEKLAERHVQVYEKVLKNTRKCKNARDLITICGAYGYHNSGDDGILSSILSKLAVIAPDNPLVVLSKKPTQTAREYFVDTLHRFSVRKIAKTFRKTALYLNGGGNLLQNATSDRSLWYYLATLALAKKRGARVMMFACGIGPIKGNFNRKLTAFVLNKYVDAITLREDSALRELEALGVTVNNVRLTADPALTLTPVSSLSVAGILRSPGLEGVKFIAVSPRLWKTARDVPAAFAEMLEFAYRKYGLHALLLPFEPVGDTPVCRAIKRKLKTPCVILSEKYKPEELIALLNRAEVVAAMRLHALIFASGQGVPLIGVSYDDKTRSFLQYLGQNLCCGIDECTGEKLIELLTAAMEGGDDRETRRAAAERLTALERGNDEAVLEQLALSNDRW